MGGFFPRWSNNTSEGVEVGAVGVEAIQPANYESQVKCVDLYEN